MLGRLKTQAKILCVGCAPVLILISLGVIATQSIKSITTTSGWVAHTLNVTANANNIVSSAVDMETGMRGYLLAGREQFLEPYDRGKVLTFDQLEALKLVVSDNPTQVERLDEAAGILREWQSNVTEPTIQLRRDIGDAPTMNDISKIVAEERGKTYFDKMRGQIDIFITREEELLIARQEDMSTARATLKSVLRDRDNIQNEIIANKSLATLEDSSKWVTHTLHVIAEAEKMLSAAIDMETGMRGYLLAGQDTFLEPYNSGNKRFYTTLATLQKTVSDNPPQVDLLAEISGTVRAWQADVVGPMIKLRRNIGDAKTMDDMADLVGEERGKIYFDKFRAVMADFRAEEEGLMSQRVAQNEETISNTYLMIIGGTIFGAILAFAFSWIVGRDIVRPLTLMTRAMGGLAAGDNKVQIPGVGRSDEVGQMASAVQVFKTNAIEKEKLEADQAQQADQNKQNNRRLMNGLADEFSVSVDEVVTSVSSAAQQMLSLSDTMAASAEKTNSQSMTVAVASDQVTNNVEMVASASEQLSTSISEVSQRISQAAKMTESAAQNTAEATSLVTELDVSAQKIDDVISLISDIAEQTNLLALNATIEAARAGESGKGFAVVANEVKNLAGQTAQATDEISNQIKAMQNNTRSVVGAIDKVGAMMNDLSETSVSIAVAVEEQHAATQEISRNTKIAADQTGNVSDNIKSVSQTADATGDAAQEVNFASSQLVQESKRLRDQVEKFLSRVRAA